MTSIGCARYRRDMAGRLRAAWDHTPLPPQTLGGIATAVLAQHARPLRLPAWTRPAGWAIICGGLAVVTAAVRERGSGSLEDPDTLVTRGMHSRSRNPMYLGLTMFQVGLAGATRNAWMLAISPVSAVLIHQAVLREERGLHERFGGQYYAYTNEVPRYL